MHIGWTVAYLRNHCAMSNSLILPVGKKQKRCSVADIYQTMLYCFLSLMGSVVEITGYAIVVEWYSFARAVHHGCFWLFDLKKFNQDHGSLFCFTFKFYRFSPSFILYLATSTPLDNGACMTLIYSMTLIILPRFLLFFPLSHVLR